MYLISWHFEEDGIKRTLDEFDHVFISVKSDY